MLTGQPPGRRRRGRVRSRQRESRRRPRRRRGHPRRPDGHQGVPRDGSGRDARTSDANDGLGNGALVTERGLKRIDDAAQPTTVAVQLSDSLAEFAASMPELGDAPPDAAYVPAAIANVSRVRSIPFALAAVLAVLALLTVGHVMLTSTRGSRRELAILRSLGARRWMDLPRRALAGHPLHAGLRRRRHPGWASSSVDWCSARSPRNMGAVDDAAIPFAFDRDRCGRDRRPRQRRHCDPRPTCPPTPAGPAPPNRVKGVTPGV